MAGCGEDSETDSSATGAGSDGGSDEVIRILYSAPLTSDPSGSGQAGCDGATQAVEDINDEGGISSGPLAGATLAIECVDDEFSTDAVATIANRYVAEEDVWVLMGFATSGQTAAAGQVAAPAGLAVIGSGTSADFLTTEADNILVIPGPLDTIGRAMSDACNTYFGGTRMANINPDFSYIDDLERGQAETAADLGMEIVAQSRYEFGAQDYSSLITKAQAADPDCVMIGDFAPTPQQVLVQARRLGFDAPFIDFCACGTAQSAADLAGDDYVGYLSGEMLPVDPPADSVLASVSAAWIEEYGARMRSHSAWSYDSVLALRYAIEGGATSREDLVNALKQIDGPGLTTRLKFGDDLAPDEATSLTLLEQVGPDVDDVEPVLSYSLNPDGTFTRKFEEQCSARETCVASN